MTTIKQKLYFLLLALVLGVTSVFAQSAFARLNNVINSAPFFTATSGTATSTFAGGATFATSGGNVGIGTASPANGLLDITGAGAAAVIRSTDTSNQTVYMKWYTNTTSLRSQIGWDNTNGANAGLAINNVDNTAIRLLTNNTERARLSGTTANFSLGSTSVAYNLLVDGGAAATTTTALGRVGAAGSKSCINLQTNLGASVAAYIVGTSWVIEAGTCK